MISVFRQSGFKVTTRTEPGEIHVEFPATLDAAADYVSTLQSARGDRGFVAFTALPVLLARAALERIESAGAGAKVSREDVAQMMDGLRRALDAGTPAVPANP